MADYIDREMVLNILSGKNAPWDGYQKVSELPTADVQPVVHGKWEDSIAKYGILIHICSVCNKHSHMAYNYCPNCGAEMDGEGNS